MLFRIVREIGGLTVRELGRRMDSQEMADWVAYFRIQEKMRLRLDLAAEAQAGVEQPPAGGRRPRGSRSRAGAPS